MAKTSKCKIVDCDGNEITKCTLCGMEISPHAFAEAETLYGNEYAVQILQCKECGALSFGWWRL